MEEPEQPNATQTADASLILHNHVNPAATIVKVKQELNEPVVPTVAEAPSQKFTPASIPQSSPQPSLSQSTAQTSALNPSSEFSASPAAAAPPPHNPSPFHKLRVIKASAQHVAGLRTKTTALVGHAAVQPIPSSRPSPLSAVTYSGPNNAFRYPAYMPSSKAKPSYLNIGKENYTRLYANSHLSVPFATASIPTYSPRPIPATTMSSSLLNWSPRRVRIINLLPGELLMIFFQDASVFLEPEPASPSPYTDSGNRNIHHAPLKHLSGTLLEPSFAMKFASSSQLPPTTDEMNQLLNIILDPSLLEKHPFQATMGLVLLSRLGLKW